MAPEIKPDTSNTDTQTPTEHRQLTPRSQGIKARMARLKNSRVTQKQMREWEFVRIPEDMIHVDPDKVGP